MPKRRTSRPTTRCQAFEEWGIAHCHTDAGEGDENPEVEDAEISIHLPW